MTDEERERLVLVGRLTELKELIDRQSREVSNLVRPLRERFTIHDTHIRDAAAKVDLVAARHELDSLAEADARLEQALAEYNTVADKLGRPKLKR